MGEQRGMRHRRAALLSNGSGRVLEIGAGTGLNLAHYPSEVDELILTEPVPAMYERLCRRARGDRRATVLAAAGDSLPVETGSVDVVTSTLVLCTVPEVDPVLAEVARVLKPGGRLLFCEHVRSEGHRAGRHQDRWAGAWARFAQGCRCNRDLLAALQRHFRVEHVQHEQWMGMPRLVQPLILGTAHQLG
ncbi:class I SAM-dependent methyltransferase [Kribbella albertanoniae]|uniref:Class I SAM-dependent methyltransferase n=1 Tax=Kribbella albertanoniae TaxID=1266829 RepID=A0A4R4QHI0_9ACTN|nr:class I SAM-dependent methyltransferase [Kribbella albertanoniae]TDC34683.1 class I SAM-dependent methyltransferase [Kribbella albertanoniae]